MQMRGSRLALGVLGLSLSMLSLGSCASPATAEGMVPVEFSLEGGHPETVKVQVEGGQETNSMGASNISNEDFVAALEMAIVSTGAFSGVIEDPEGAADYLLEVAIVDLERPAAGFDMTCGLTTSWKLSEVGPEGAAGALVFQEYIDTEYTATTGDAFAGIKRLRLANEGAGRRNIEEGLKRVVALELGEPRP